MAYTPYQMKGPALYNKGKKPKGKKKKKTVEDYLNEGFSQAEAEQMAKDGATTGESAAPFLGKLVKGVGKFAKGMVTGKDGKFGIGDVGRLALGPMGAVAGGAMGAGLFKKGKKPTKK
jgi:hypothetical protein